MEKNYFVYYMTNQSNKVLYLGITNELVRRVAEHKTGVIKGFSSRYKCNKLVYYEVTNSIEEAIRREKQLKNWKREWKNELINGMNSEWRDLSGEIGVTDEVIESVIEYNREIAGQARNDKEVSNKRMR